MQACGLTEIIPLTCTSAKAAAVWWLLQMAGILSFLNSLRVFDCKTAITKGCDILRLLIWQEISHCSVVLFLLFILVSQRALTGLQTLNPQLPRVTSFSNLYFISLSLSTLGPLHVMLYLALSYHSGPNSDITTQSRLLDPGLPWWSSG